MLLPTLLLLPALAVHAVIDRQAVVSSYNIVYNVSKATDLDRFAALTIGNGAFAINVDPTGLQTIPQVVSAFDLNTLCDWQFHSTPTTSPPTCAEVPENGQATVTCGGAGNSISAIVFASYGAPTGSCSSGFVRSPTCDAGNSTAIAAAACVGRATCTLPALNSVYGDPCLGTTKRLAVQVACASPPPPPSRAAALDNYRYSYYDTPTSATATVSRPFATDGNTSGGVQSWPMVNPHRVGMGELALRLVPPGATPGTPDPPMLPPAAITNLTAVLDVWAGGVSSAFTLADAQGSAWALTIATSIHPDADLVATALTCTPAPASPGALPPPPASGCPAALRLGFAYATGAWGPGANAWGSDPALHTTAVLLNDTARAALTLYRVMDDAAWTVSCQWDSSQWRVARAAGLAHEFLWLPPPGAPTTSIALSCLWTPAGLAYPVGMASSAYVQRRVAAAGALLAPGAPRLPLQPAVQAASAAMWQGFWQGGAFVHLLASASADPRAAELERRTVLSRFLTRSSSAGACPPQETGLLANSWSGKFHLEMRFWHQAHWPLWGNPELLHNSNGFYFDLLPNATSTARFQGYRGARWLKMLGLANTHNASGAVDVAWLGTAVQQPPAWAPPGQLLTWESFNGINPVLQWQQPHMVWLADAQRRAVNASQGAAAAAALLAELAPLVYATADYLASAPFFNESSGFYELGPPLLGGEEFGDFLKISRATFETTYFAYALDIANEWRLLAGLPLEPTWDRVASLLGNLPLDPAQAEPTYSFNAAAACCYVPASECPPGRFGGRSQCSPLSGHPMPAGVLGMVNGRRRGDRYGVSAAAANATVRVMVERWAAGWGWDNPLIALAMTRMAWDPSAVVDYLLQPNADNQYIRTGYNFMGEFAYLPGNGGTLLAVAMMAAGTDTSPAMAFPAEWGAQAEGFVTAYP